jgi:uncharacterized membrane-anchored protein
MRKLILILTTIIVLILINLEIIHKEELLQDGTLILLKLAPRDPRSLMQGDYMVLRYEIAQQPALSSAPRDGHLVIETDNNRIAQFKRFYDNTTPLQKTEYLLRFRKRGDSFNSAIRLGAESFFFQEGDGEYYAQARYGELRVAATGESVLVGLRDENLQPLLAPPVTEP